MSTLVDRYRAHRTVVRRNRAIEKALSGSSSPAMRDEILTLASRIG